VIILRKKLQEPFVIRPIATLQRVNEHQPPAGLRFCIAEMSALALSEHRLSTTAR
jgi:hypothetical protein